MPMWKFLGNYFTFSTRERNGILLLLFLSAAVLLAPKIYFYFKPVQHADNTRLQAEVDAFAKEYYQQTHEPISNDDTANPKMVLDISKPVTKTSTTSAAYFKFDPNKIDVAEWIKLGFTERQAQSIEKYKAHGGKFYKAEDLKRVYVIGEEGYKRLAEYVVIDKAALDKEYTSVQYFTFDPNTIGVNEWMKLGFSEKQARSIEKYKATGAVFHKPQDLKKVYVIGEDGYERLKPYIKIR